MRSATFRYTGAIHFFTALLPAVVLSMSIAAPAFAISITNGMAATLVLGQPNFTSLAGVTTQTGMNSPNGAAVDPTTGKVFVAETANNRILRFASVCSLVNGAPAEAVLGQSNFTSSTAATAQNRMSSPVGPFVDSGGRLWVADVSNGRVLRFDNAASKANGANADGVLGQPNFTSSTSATTQSGMNYPLGVFVDSGGRMWVADSGNSRILRFDNAAAKTNGAGADGVLGQANFTSSTGAVTQVGMNSPTAVFVDSAGRMWVADQLAHRVLRFDNAASKANGAGADGVLGQPNYTNSTGATTQSGMKYPVGVSGDVAGRLYVAEDGNNRVLVFNNAPTKSNGSNADNVLGQASFTSGGSATTATTLNGPSGLFYDRAADVLWVGDAINNRVLRYGIPACALVPIIMQLLLN